MDLDALLDEVLCAVDRKAFVTPLDGLDDPEERALLAPIFDGLGAVPIDATALRVQIADLAANGQITGRRAVILLQTVAAHPDVLDLLELARLLGEEEHLVLVEGGPRMSARLAVLDHHRAVHAFLLGRLEVALALETRSAAARPWGDSLANILILLLRLDQEERARTTLRRLRTAAAPHLVAQVERYIRADPDLAPLRDELEDADARPVMETAPEARAPMPRSNGPDLAEPAPEENDPCDPVLH